MAGGRSVKRRQRRLGRLAASLLRSVFQCVGPRCVFVSFSFFSPLALPLFRCVLRLWQPCIIGKTLTFRPPHTPLVPPPEERFPFRGAAFFGRGTSAFASRGGEQPPLTRFSLLFLCFLSTSLGRG